MLELILKFGRMGTTGLITLFSISASRFVTLTIFGWYGEQLTEAGELSSILAPALIAPFITWHIIGLMIRTHDLEEQMRTLATYDSLTGVMSRGAFITHYETVYQVIVRNQSSLSLLYIDIDDFKKINDSYGHPAGDAVLKSFGDVLQQCRRKSDLVGRIGAKNLR